MAAETSKTLAEILIERGLSSVHAVIAAGAITEQLQKVELEAYQRGHKDGYRQGYREGYDKWKHISPHGDKDRSEKNFLDFGY